jgi:hypothetical protein
VHDKKVSLMSLAELFDDKPTDPREPPADAADAADISIEPPADAADISTEAGAGDWAGIDVARNFGFVASEPPPARRAGGHMTRFGRKLMEEGRREEEQV